MIPTADCGHEYKPEGCTAGYATDNDGKTLCYPCADEAQRVEMRTSSKYLGYLAQGKHGLQITTWTGGLLMDACVISKRGWSPIGKTNLFYLNARDVWGNKWHGTSPGVGMYAKMRRSKTERS